MLLSLLYKIYCRSWTNLAATLTTNWSSNWPSCRRTKLETKTALIWPRACCSGPARSRQWSGSAQSSTLPASHSPATSKHGTELYPREPGPVWRIPPRLCWISWRNWTGTSRVHPSDNPRAGRELRASSWRRKQRTPPPCSRWWRWRDIKRLVRSPRTRATWSHQTPRSARRPPEERKLFLSTDLSVHRRDTKQIHGKRNYRGWPALGRMNHSSCEEEPGVMPWQPTGRFEAT